MVTCCPALRVATRHAVLMTLGAWIALVGCQRGERLYPVSGHVTCHDGTPLVGHRVIFQADNGSYSAVGQTDSSGHYQLGTYGAGDGARAGVHRVAIVPSIDPTTESLPPPVYPKAFYDPATSPLTLEVLEQVNRIPIRLPAPD